MQTTHAGTYVPRSPGFPRGEEHRERENHDYRASNCSRPAMTNAWTVRLIAAASYSDDGLFDALASASDTLADFIKSFRTSRLTGLTRW